jgi:hypothetical protein
VNTFKHRSQGPPVAGPWVRPLWVALFLAAVICSITGCASGVPDNALQLSPETLEQRKLQTRRFDGIAEPEILSACAAVLQDLGFNLDESETELDARQIAAALLLEIVGWDMDTDEKQLIRASLVTRPADGFSPEDPDNSFYVRITFQRVVWNSNNEVSRTERLDEPELYQGFFDRLSKSVFLEGHKI